MKSLLVVFNSPLFTDLPDDHRFVREAVETMLRESSVLMLGHSCVADAWVFQQASAMKNLAIVQFLPNNMRRDYDRPGSDGKRVVKASNWQGRSADLAMTRAAKLAHDKGWEVDVIFVASEVREGEDLWPAMRECKRLGMHGNEYIMNAEEPTE